MLRFLGSKVSANFLRGAAVKAASRIEAGFEDRLERMARLELGENEDERAPGAMSSPAIAIRDAGRTLRREVCKATQSTAALLGLDAQSDEMRVFPMFRGPAEGPVPVALVIDVCRKPPVQQVHRWPFDGR